MNTLLAGAMPDPINYNKGQRAEHRVIEGAA
jgi:hypothetical protein